MVESEDYTAPTERRRSPASRSEYRTLPPAVTPLRAVDLAAGAADHARGRGRDAFRAALVEYLDAAAGGTYTSFRRALAACLSELADGADGSVLVPAFCSADFPDAVEGVGLDVERYDVDPATLAADVDSLEARSLDDALALVSVNVLGYGSPMDAVATLCEANDVHLVEALGYALGTRYGGRRLGTFGDRAVLNFQQGKPIPVGGGMVVSQTKSSAFDDAGRPAVDPNIGTLAGYALFSRPRLYHVYTRLADRMRELGALGDRVTTHPESKFDVEYAPPFATMSDFQGAVALRVFRRLGVHRRERARTARFYADAFAGIDGIGGVTPVAGLSQHQHVRYPLLADSPALRDRLRSALRANGAEATVLYDWPEIDGDRFPGAARLQRHVVTLPTHPYVDPADRRRIVDTVREVVDEGRR